MLTWYAGKPCDLHRCWTGDDAATEVLEELSCIPDMVRKALGLVTENGAGADRHLHPVDPCLGTDGERVLGFRGPTKWVHFKP